MRVLQLIQKPQLRGAEIFACQLSLELVKKGVDVDVAYLFPDKGMLVEKFPGLTFLSVGGKSSTRLFDFPGYRNLHRMIMKGQYDIVQANAGDTLKYAVLSKKFYGWSTPLIFRNANKMSDFFRNAIHQKINKWLLSQCDYFVSVSELCRRDLISILPPARERSATITIGTDLLERVARDSRSAHPIFINIGALVPEKNQSFLLDIFGAWIRKWSKGELWLVGDGRLRDELERKSVALDLHSHVKFLGYQSDAVALLRQSDALIMPSLIEGLPGVILEALSSGVPVIASAVGGIPEVIENGRTGFCLEEYNAAAYVNAMERIVGEDEIRRTLVDNGYDRIKRDFQLADIAGKFLETYRRLAVRK